MSEDNETILPIRVLPGASRNQIEHSDSGTFKIKLTAPPVEGKANKLLQRFLAKKLGVSKTRVEIVSGWRGREKVIKIHGLSDEEVNRRLG